MTVIGLTGKTGSGKSTICQILKSKGVYIIDTDVIARKIVEKDMPALKALTECFGDVILNIDKTLNRKALAKLAFSSRVNTEKLNAITHPYIAKEVKKEIDFAKQNGYDFCVIDAAVLLESECRNYCNIIAVVSADETVRLKRIVERDDIDESSAQIRMQAQKEDEYYFEKADIIIINDDNADLQKEAQRLIDFAKGKI